MYTVLHSFKIEPTDNQKLVKGKDRGDLWFICESCVKIFEQAEVEFLRECYKDKLWHCDIFDEKLFCEKLMEKTCWWLDIQSDVGKYILEQTLGLYLRIRTFSKAKNVHWEQS